HGLLDRRLRAPPRRAAELVEPRLHVLTRGVAPDEIERLHRRQELAAARVLDLHDFALGVAERNALQTAEATVAVVDVDDVVARLEVAKVGEERIRLAFLSADTRRGR